MDIKVELLKLFPNLNEVDLAKLIEIGNHKKVTNKEMILSPGNKKKMGFLILKGTIRGYIVNKKGQEKILMLRSEGTFVADAECLFNNAPQKISIEAIEDSHILMFNFEEFEALVKQHGPLLDMYLNVLKEAILILRYRLDSMITMTHEERYIDLIKSNPKFIQKAYSKYVATYLGITSVSLSRIAKRVGTVNIR